MKITILHGENVPAAREHFWNLRQKAKARGWTTTKMAFPPTASLFDTKSLYVLDGLESLEPTALAWLASNWEKYDLILLAFHKGEISAKTAKLLPEEAKFQKFDLPQKIFVLLQAFYPGNQERFLTLLHEVIKDQPIEFVFSLLCRQVRDLYWVLADRATLSYPSWRMSKLNSQAKRFDQQRLKVLIEQLAEIDIKAKTSQADLLTSLDLLAVSQLE